MAVSAAVLGAAAIGVATSVAGAEAQKDAAKKANRTQRDAQNRQIDLQERMFAEGQPYRDMALAQLNDLRAQYMSGNAYGSAQFNEEMRNTNNALSATGNLRSGLAQDLTQRASERAYDRNLMYRTALGQSIAGLATGQGNASNAQGLSLQPGINQGYENISNLQMARGGIQSGLYNSIGNTLGGALMFGGMYGGGLFNKTS